MEVEHWGNYKCVCEMNLVLVVLSVKCLLASWFCVSDVQQGNAFTLNSRRRAGASDQEP